MRDIQDNHLPVTGFFAWFIQRFRYKKNPNLVDEYVFTPPGLRFVDLIASVLRERRIRICFTIGALLEMLFIGIYTFLPMIVGHVSHDLLDAQKDISFDDIISIISLTAGLIMIAMILNPILVRFSSVGLGLAEAQVRRQLTWWTLGHSASWFAVREAGQIAHRVAEISKQVHIVFNLCIYQISGILAALITVSGVMFFIYFYAGLFFSLWALSFIALSLALGVISQKFVMRFVEKRTQASGLATDAIINHALVRLFHGFRQEDRKLDDLSNRCFAVFMEASTWHMFKNGLRDLWMLCMVICMIALLGYELVHGRILPSEFISGLGILFLLLSQIRSLHHVIRDVMESVGSIREGLSEIGQPHDIEEKVQCSDLVLSSMDLKIDDVSFNYHTKNSVLHDINLNIPAGQRLGIVGPSGAGKTTLMALLLRLWDSAQGEVMLGQVNIKDLSFFDLRAHMALIPQDTSMFHRSLMDNIRYGRLDASDEEVIEAAKKAHAHEFIAQLPDGYQTLVGERGVKLSGGQRQRIAIARAILKDAPILILDEATSALDSESETLIQKSLESLMEGKTVIAIAHRLSTIAHLDRLIVMDQGRIVEDGTHDALKDKKGSLYAKLWSMQSGGFIKDA